MIHKQLCYQQPPTGGFESYTYQWQLSNDGISWTNVGTNQDFIIQPIILLPSFIKL